MEEIRARNVVIGAGAMGAAAAYHLARRGEPVVLLEQFTLGHDRGSSHGAARITRHSYADPHYARLMPEAFRAWRELEADAGQNLYLRTGGISFCPPGVDYVARVAANLAAIGVPHRRMTGAELRRALPVFEVGDKADVVFEPDAGMLAAARAVALQVELARYHGGDATRVIEECPVRRVDLDGTRPVVLSDTHRIVAERLIITAGAWVGRLVPALANQLRPTRQQVTYLQPADRAPFVPGAFPVFIYKGSDPLDDYYGMPMWRGLGVKVARHGGPDVDPDRVERTVGEEYRETVRTFLRKSLPSLAEADIDRTEVCLYTVAPDDRFSVDVLTGRTDVVVASPCSGHGFKFSCLIGRLLADFAATGTTEFAINPRGPRDPLSSPGMQIAQ
jgi:sarcosine oxidase